MDVLAKQNLWNPDWYRAVTLKERASRFSSNGSTPSQTAETWLQRWRSQKPFQLDEYYHQRLQQDGLDETKFQHILGETAETIQSHFTTPPDWLTDFQQAFSQFSTPETLPEPIATQTQTTFLAAITPLVAQSIHRLQAGVETLFKEVASNQIGSSYQITALLSAQWSDKLLFLMNRTMALEMHVARMQGLLSGNTPEERFASFVSRLQQPAIALTLWQEYPVLARLLVTSLNNMVKAQLELIQRLSQDYIELCQLFGQEIGSLTHVEAGLGDSHQAGRAVMSLVFGSGLKLVYKPKSLLPTQHFQELLVWFNKQGQQPPFRILRVLNRPQYGWMEFAGAEFCHSEAEIGRFYQRLGAYLALLYGLRANDFHFQNVIADGEHPVLVDIETFIQPGIGEKQTLQGNASAHNAMMNSVLRVGLLPQRSWHWVGDDTAGVDFSGIGASAGQVFPKLIPRWDAQNTDEMRLVRKREVFAGSQNQPTLQGQAVNPLDYAEDLMVGFRQMYRLLFTHRNVLLSEDGPLTAFANDEMRVILRSTMVYSMLLKDGNHPDLLRNALAHDLHLDRLWVGIEMQPAMAQVIASEHHDLWQNDIPIFTIHPNSRDLWDSRGNQIPDFFAAAGLDLTHKRLLSLSLADCDQQEWFIQASLLSLATHDHRSQTPLTPAQTAELKPAPNNDLLAVARQVGDRLEKLAYRHEADAAWIGLSTVQNSWLLTPLGVDLYGGLPGVSLFLAYLGAVSGEDRYTTLAQAALSTLLQELENPLTAVKPIGAFNGWGGIIYTLTHLGILWQQPGLLDQAQTMAEKIPYFLPEDKHLDVMGGAAGAIAALLTLYQVRPAARTLEIATLCGDHLLQTAQPMETGLGWVGPAGPQPLTGFSHGSAGIAWALLKLSQATGQERFYQAALAAIAYERSLFRPEAHNWLDVRPLPPGREPFMTAWCHGAVGIGLGRLASLGQLDTLDVHHEIQTAVSTTLQHGFGNNHSLCHGDLGNLELLSLVAERFDTSQQETVKEITAVLLHDLQQHGPRCGTPLTVETPGLMNGLAGIGYGLLRLAAPEKVPSVLLLEKPFN